MEPTSESLISRLKELDRELNQTPGAVVSHPELVKEVIDAIPDAVVLATDDDRILLINLAAEEMFGYTHDELLGSSVTTLIPQRFRAAHTAKQSEFFREPKTRVFDENAGVYGLRRDGTEVPLTALLKPIEFGGLVFAMAILRRRS